MVEQYGTSQNIAECHQTTRHVMRPVLSEHSRIRKQTITGPSIMSQLTVIELAGPVLIEAAHYIIDEEEEYKVECIVNYQCCYTQTLHRVVVTTL